MVKLSDLRKYAINLLLQNDIKEARADVDFLLFALAKADKGDLILGTKEIDFQTENLIKEALGRRLKGEPVQYITGECEFYGYNFKVNKSTLIPRADTEILVEKAAEIIEKNNLKTFLDIGCGSGCVGISLLKIFKDLKGHFVDISKDALEIAKENANALGVLNRGTFEERDILNSQKSDLKFYDIIVSNPPYIETENLKILEDKVKDFEPVSALDGGEDGLDFYRSITDLAAEKSSYLAFEIGYNQGKTVFDIMDKHFCDIELFKDYGGQNRVLTGKINKYS